MVSALVCLVLVLGVTTTRLTGSSAAGAADHNNPPASNWVVVTSIQYPTEDVKSMCAHAAKDPDLEMVVVADTKTPLDWHAEGCTFLSVAMQKTLGLQTAALLPYKSYARKNIGYLGQAPMKKKFAWLVQGKSHNIESEAWFGDSRDVYYLTYVDPPPESPFNVFQPGATWTEGRNRLLEAAVARSLSMADGGYEYYVFMDDDVPAMADGDVNGRLMNGFEQFLNVESPATAGAQGGQEGGSVDWRLMMSRNRNRNEQTPHCRSFE